MQVAPQTWPSQPCLVQDPCFRPWPPRAGWKQRWWLMRAWVRAGRETDVCSDIPIVAKTRQEPSDPTSSKKKAGD